MTIAMGPVLRLQDRRDQTWYITALIVSDRDDVRLSYWEPDAAEWQQPEPTVLLQQGGRHVLRFPLDIPLGEKEKTVRYRLDDGEEEWKFCVPSRSDNRLRATFVSCNGFSSNKERRATDAPYERWEDLLQRHEDSPHGPFQLLLMGGDQIYADTIWDRVPLVSEWTEESGEQRWRRSEFTEPMRQDVDDFYFDVYVRSWGQRSQAMRTALGSIPTMMMWDDHDIFDGWGSYEQRKLDSPVYQGLYQRARRHFEIFQLQREPGTAGPSGLCDTGNLTYGITLGDIGILALDLRSERTETQVISPESWDQIYAWLDQLPDEIQHLLIISSVPVVHVDLSGLEPVTGFIGWKLEEYCDDLRDHWLSRPHKQERLRLIHRLFDFSEANSTRVTVLSGDIHVAALGLLEKQQDPDSDARGGSIYQIISSPMIHPTPPVAIRYVYDWMADDIEEVDRGITSRFVKMPASNQYYIARRNWVDIEIDRTARRRLWCNWHVEPGPGDEAPAAYTHAIYRRE